MINFKIPFNFILIMTRSLLFSSFVFTSISLNKKDSRKRNQRRVQDTERPLQLANTSHRLVLSPRFSNVHIDGGHYLTKFIDTTGRAPIHSQRSRTKTSALYLELASELCSPLLESNSYVIIATRSMLTQGSGVRSYKVFSCKFTNKSRDLGAQRDPG